MTSKTEVKIDRRTGAELKTPNYQDFCRDSKTVGAFGFLSIASTDVLLAIAHGDVDVKRLAQMRLAAGGMDENGLWIGFEAAKKLWLS